MTMRVGRVPDARRIRSTIGSSMPASVMMPKYRIAKTNIAATDAVCCRPLTRNCAVVSPKPPTSAAAVGTRDERDEGRHQPAHDQGQQQQHGREAEQREHSRGYARTPPGRPVH